MKAFAKFTWQNYPNGSFQSFNLNIRLRRGSVKTMPLCEMNATCSSIARAGSSMCCIQYDNHYCFVLQDGPHDLYNGMIKCDCTSSIT